MADQPSLCGREAGQADIGGAAEDVHGPSSGAFERAVSLGSPIAGEEVDRRSTAGEAGGEGLDAAEQVEQARINPHGLTVIANVTPEPGQAKTGVAVEREGIGVTEADVHLWRDGVVAANPEAAAGEPVCGRRQGAGGLLDVAGFGRENGCNAGAGDGGEKRSAIHGMASKRRRTSVSVSAVIWPAARAARALSPSRRRGGRRRREPGGGRRWRRQVLRQGRPGAERRPG